MAEIGKPPDTEEKKTGGKVLMGRTKLPMDAILLVVVPFVSFMLLFMYAMGLIPPRPPHVQVVGTQPGEESQKAISEPVERPEPILTVPTAIGESPGDVQTAAAGADTMEVAGLEAEEPSEPGAIAIEGSAEIASPDTTATDEEKAERIKQLAKVYEQMNASSVAAIVASMDDSDAVGILSNMNPRSAAKVLASLEPERAAVLSLMLTR